MQTPVLDSGYSGYSLGWFVWSYDSYKMEWKLISKLVLTQWYDSWWYRDRKMVDFLPGKRLASHCSSQFESQCESHTDRSLLMRPSWKASENCLSWGEHTKCTHFGNQYHFDKFDKSQGKENSCVDFTNTRSSVKGRRVCWLSTLIPGFLLHRYLYLIFNFVTLFLISSISQILLVLSSVCSILQKFNSMHLIQFGRYKKRLFC